MTRFEVIVIALSILAVFVSILVSFLTIRNTKKIERREKMVALQERSIVPTQGKEDHPDIVTVKDDDFDMSITYRKKPFGLRKNDSLSVGRDSSNNISLDDVKVSRRHFQIEATEEGYKIVDLDSSNGTFLNGKRVKSSMITHGDVIQVSIHIFNVEDHSHDLPA